MAPRRWVTYLKIAVLWLFGLLVTTVLAVGAGFSAGFSDNAGLEGNKAWPSVIIVAVVCLGALAAWTRSLVRTDHRWGGTASLSGVAAVVAGVLLLLVVGVLSIRG